MRRRPILLKRVYDKPAPDDGLRVLVDRLWPRGMTRQELSADLWLKDAAPSPGLRRWYGHDPQRWDVFAHKYRTELAREPDVLRTLDDLRRRARVTLLFAARDVRHSHAVVLRDVLESRSWTS
ncbi:MAG TPA: DUF488 family protein [Burkholderiales bacterium]|nr:DUF488 family protein [Burkholderiales bacterium]